MKLTEPSTTPTAPRTGPTSTPAQEDARPPEHEAGSLSALLKSWRYFFWLLGLVLLVVVFYAEENWRGQHAWETYRHQLELRGKRLDPSAFVPPPVPRSQNFAMTPLLAPLFDFLPGTQRWRTTNSYEAARNFAPRYEAAARAIKLPKPARSNSWVSAATDLVTWYSALQNPTNDQPGTAVADDLSVPEAAAGVLAVLSESDAALEEIRAASQRRYARFEIHYNEEDPAGILLPHLAIIKNFCLVLQLRASAELTVGRMQAAADDVNLMLYLTETCRDEPIMVSQLVRMALVQLAIQPIVEGLGQWSEQQLLGFQQRLQRFNFCADLELSLEAERVFFGGGVIDFLHRNPEKYNDLTGNGGGALGVLWAAVPSGWFDFEKLNYNRLFEDHVMAANDLAGRRISPSSCRQTEQRVAALFGKQWPNLFFRHRVFASLLAPAFSGAFRKTAFAQTAADTTMLACALERCRLARGQFPEALEGLVLPGVQGAPKAEGGQPAGFIDKLPNDMISGQPLRYRRNPDGQYVLYSIGWNERDDGGTVVVGKGEVPLEGDWVWRPVGRR